MIHGLLYWGSPDTDRKRWKFFSTVRYQVGGLSYSLDDVEHGVLRCNTAHPYKPQAQFGADDLRRQVSLGGMGHVDPRVHFAMVCGARGCPPVRVFRGASVEQELQEAATAFCSDPGSVLVDLAAKTIEISRILYWFSKDFGKGSAGDVAYTYVLRYAVGDDVGMPLALAEREFNAGGGSRGGWFSGGNTKTGGWKVSFKEYDWSPNGVGLMAMH